MMHEFGLDPVWKKMAVNNWDNLGNFNMLWILDNFLELLLICLGAIMVLGLRLHLFFGDKCLSISEESFMTSAASFCMF